MNQYKIFSEIAPGQTRIGFFDAADVIQDVWICRDDQPDLTGSVHQARVEQVFAGQNRASGRLADGIAISIKLPKTGREAIVVGVVVVVTIIAPPRHGKAWQAVLDARLITAALVLLPSQSAINQSCNLGDKGRADLQVPEGYGLILRRYATKMNRVALQAVIDDLVVDWEIGVPECDPAIPSLLYLGGSLRQRAMRALPNAAYHICSVGDARSQQIDAAVATATQLQVYLPSGGKLWCQRTHALWAIDIDGADANVQKLGFDNLLSEAAGEIARQIRLRGMSGSIMVDVPRAGLAKNIFLAKLKKCFSDDPQNPEILGLTRGGMLELWRPYGRMALDDIMADEIPQAALAGLRLAAARPAFKPVHMAVNTAMAEWFAGTGKDAVAALERPLTLDVCLNNGPTVVAYIIDKAEASN